MLEPKLITLFIDPLEKNKIDYMITGSVASIIYGEPRLTHDIDLILNLKKTALQAFIHSFPLEQFFCPPQETILIELGRDSRAHINLIHHQTGFKADCYFTGRDPLHAWGMAHRRRMEIDPETFIWLAPPEYVILRKLEFFREGKSTKHINDIQKMLEISGAQIDVNFLEKKIQEMGFVQEWAQLKQ